MSVLLETVVSQHLLLAEAGGRAREENDRPGAIDHEVVFRQVPCVVGVQPQALAGGGRDVAGAVRQQEEVLFAADERIADVFDDAEDIRYLFPVVVPEQRGGFFRVQRSRL